MKTGEDRDSGCGQWQPDSVGLGEGTTGVNVRSSRLVEQRGWESVNSGRISVIVSGNIWSARGDEGMGVIVQTTREAGFSANTRLAPDGSN